MGDAVEERHEMDRGGEAGEELLEMLEAVKRKHPELADILPQFQMDQSEYDRAMLAIMAAETQPRNTCATSQWQPHA